jgi:hypothetical protein
MIQCPISLPVEHPLSIIKLMKLTDAEKPRHRLEDVIKTGLRETGCDVVH